ncbi:MAG: TIGR00266 family protein [Candidatus Riflebacteria bacterium]|nr:TIGR00266 family protein [Candidatus Riflebacteria bacterium]
MNVELLFQGSYCMAKLTLNGGEEVKAESDAMVAMTSNISVEGKAEGGVFGMLKRTFTGESAFMQTLKNNGSNPGEVHVAPSEPGDLAVIELNGSNGYILQKGAFLASESGIVMDTVSQGIMKGLLSGEGFFLQKATGNGKLVISSFGAILKKTLAPNEIWIVDNGHMVAWSDTVNYEIKKASSGLISSFTSGEGLVCQCKGPGDIFIQSRNPSGFAGWVRQFIPSKN